MGLVLTRIRNQCVLIGEDIVVRIDSVDGQKVRLDITAPPEVPILRDELYEAEEEHKRTTTGRGELPYMPGLDEIEEGAARERAKWDEKTRQKRAGEIVEPYQVPKTNDITHRKSDQQAK